MSTVSAVMPICDSEQDFLGGESLHNASTRTAPYRARRHGQLYGFLAFKKNQ